MVDAQWPPFMLPSQHTGPDPEARARRPEGEAQHLISRRKPVYAPSDDLLAYLERYERIVDTGADYASMLRYAGATAHYDEHGEDTLWITVFYGPAEQREVHDALRVTYALLKSGGDLENVEHLYVDRVDLCLYGNTLPFRVRIVNALNENFDYFYVKRVDANRIYGLELEHVLSPNRINYLVHGETLIEEHIVGIPADMFIRDMMPTNRFDEVRLAKEFVKFNERCLVRLLGDMHSGNYVVDLTPDFEKMQYRLRPIDFDQQSHHWKRQVYQPQFYPQNKAIIALGMQHMNATTFTQYRREERALIAGRIRSSEGRYGALMDAFREDLIAPRAYVRRLGEQLADYYGSDLFERAQTMGELVEISLQRALRKHEEG
jgi:hypothetical protein